LAIKDSIRDARNAARAKKMEDIQKRREELKNKRAGNKTNVDKVKEEDTEVKTSGEKAEETVEVKTTEETTEVVPAVKTKEQLRAEKRQILLDRIAKQKAKRDSLKQVAADKRAKKIAEIKARKEKLKEKNNNN